MAQLRARNHYREAIDSFSASGDVGQDFAVPVEYQNSVDALNKFLELDLQSLSTLLPN